MEFLSRSDDKKLRWIITENQPQPHLLDPDKLPDQDGEVKGEGEDKSRENVEDDKDQKETEAVGDKTLPSPMESEVQQSSQKQPPSRGSWRGRRGRGRGDRGAILLTSLEQEMLLWALGGFLPVGPEGLKPTSEHQVRIA